MARKPAAPDASDVLLERLRGLCFGFASVGEKLSHGAPSFFVLKGKMFAMFADDHHGSRHVAVWVKSTFEDQKRLVKEDPARYFVPPYVGVSGWVGVVLDHPKMDWIELAIILEAGWTSVVPKRLANGPVKPPPKPLVRKKTDPVIAQKATDKLIAIAEKLPEVSHEGDWRDCTFRVRKKSFAYLTNNHHGDGIVGLCVKMAKGKNASLTRKDPARFFMPQYMAARGWGGVRLDAKGVDWKDVEKILREGYRLAAPKTLAAEV